MKRPKKEADLTAKVVICIGAHWPSSVVPEDALYEAVNEFLAMPRPDLLLQLVSEGKLSLHVSKTKAPDGSWLLWSR
jgi:hypothetical protein